MFEALGARVARLGEQDIDDRGIALIRNSFMDTIGVMLAGTGEDAFRIARQVLQVSAGSGPSLVIGSGDRRSAFDAGQLNGIAGHVLDYDDNNLTVLGHPSTILVPAVLALGEELDSSARELATAYAAGYEVMLRIARDVHPVHYDKGWHPTATIGVFGAAASAARLLELDASGVATSLAIAASMAAGIKANFGTMVKSLHIGNSVRNGLLAARLAEAGFTSNPGAFEAEQGFLKVFNGTADPGTERIFHDLDGAPEVNIGSNPVKVFPCCGSTHTSVVAALELRRRDEFALEDIERITITVDPARMPHTDRPALTDPLSGKFSLQYVVARALIQGSVGLDDFEGRAHEDPDVGALMRRIDVEPSAARRAQAFDATVNVATRGGKQYSAVALGAGLLDVDRAQLETKFEDCAGRILGPEQTAAALAMLRSFPGQASARELSDLLAPTDCIREHGGALADAGAGVIR